MTEEVTAMNTFKTTPGTTIKYFAMSRLICLVASLAFDLLRMIAQEYCQHFLNTYKMFNVLGK